MAAPAECPATTVDDILITRELDRRPARAPDHAAENRSLVELAALMADSPTVVLQRLAGAALELCRAGSAGVSIWQPEVEADMFRWRAAAGGYAPYLGGTMPRDFSPCGEVLRRDAPLLMVDPHRFYPYISELSPPVREVLLIPFYHGGTAVGTVWVVSHTPERRFDAEDVRLVTSLTRFAGAAVQTLSRIDAAEKAEESLRKLAADLSEAGRLKDEFLATLAHELRNPLAPIRNGLTVIRSGPTDAAREKTVGMMERQVGQLVRLVDDLLDVSRVSTGKVTLRRERVALQSVAEAAAETNRPLIEMAGHELTLRFPDHPVFVDADPGRITQVLTNLLNNAAKYTPPGGRIELSVAGVGREAVVRVADNGVGIPADLLPKVFDTFVQVGSSLERSQGGLGLGLTLARKLVEMHGGSVSAESGGDRMGSTFTVRLPVADEPVGASPARSGASAETAPASLRVLVVDDNHDGAESMAEMLRLLGDEVRTAHDGVEAIEEAEQFRPDVILMDVGMPRMNGLDATRRIRGQPWGEGVAIIALTGWGQEGDRARSREAGCDGHLVKPVNLNDLEKLLGELRPGG